MGTTTYNALPYPEPGADVDVAKDIKALAQAADTSILTSGVMRFATKSVRDSTLVGALAPVPGMMAYAADTDYTEQYITIGAWSGWAPLPGSVVADFKMNAVLSIANASFIGVSWQTTIKDRLAAMNANRMQYNPKVPGLYTSVLYGHWGGAAGGGRCIAHMMNGAYYGMQPFTLGSAAAPSTVTCQVVAPMNGTTDNVQVVAYQNSGAPVNLDSDSSRWMITYSGPS
jgi:hypothetical protein